MFKNIWNRTHEYTPHIKYFVFKEKINKILFSFSCFFILKVKIVNNKCIDIYTYMYLVLHNPCSLKFESRSVIVHYQPLNKFYTVSIKSIYNILTNINGIKVSPWYICPTHICTGIMVWMTFEIMYFITLLERSIFLWLEYKFIGFDIFFWICIFHC